MAMGSSPSLSTGATRRLSHNNTGRISGRRGGEDEISFRGVCFLRMPSYRSSTPQTSIRDPALGRCSARGELAVVTLSLRSAKESA